jgi:hypothetical protein
MQFAILRVLAWLMKEQLAITWAERAQAELGASRRFRQLLVRLQRLNTNPHILQRVEQAEQEEDLHAFLCSKMAMKLGHATGFAIPRGISKTQTYSWVELPERDRLLLDVVVLGCITESLNASLLNTIYAKSDGGEASRLIHRILKDEVKHAQIGWAYLGEECKARDCSFVSDYLVEMVQISVNDALFQPVTVPLSDASYAFGVMPHHARREQFNATLDEVVCAGLEHFGIDTSDLRNWLGSH